ncbi:MAG: hypothetical protein ABH883_02100 [Candidatus Omnitrophota bacterium]
MINEKMFKFCFGCAPAEIARQVILTPFFPLKAYMENCKAAREFRGRLYRGFTAPAGSSEITVIQCGIGDRLLGDAVMFLSITGAERIIFNGTCGGFKGCGISDILVADNAFNGEGFSRYYGRNAPLENIFSSGELVSADKTLTLSLKKFLSGKKVYYNPGENVNIFTIGSLAAEKNDILSRIEERGFKGLEMELSAVYKASISTGIPAAGLLVVSDLPLARPLWEELSPAEKKLFSEKMNEVMKLTVEFAVGPGGTEPAG